MRLLLIVLALVVPAIASAKERAAFLAGQYATAAQCEKLRAIEAGGPHNVSTAAEVLDADGCAFTRIFEHEPGRTWLALMICPEGPSITPATYVFAKDGDRDAFEVHAPGAEDGPETYTPCDARKGK